MTVKKFKQTDVYKIAKKVRFFDLNGIDISNKYPLILDLLEIIGYSYSSDGMIDIDLQYIE